MGILDNIVKWIAEQVMHILDLITTSVLGALGCDMSTFLRYFPAADTMYQIFVAIAIGLIMLNWVWQLFRNFGLVAGEEAEDPIKLSIRSLLFILLTLFANDITDIALRIGGTPYRWIMTADLPPISFAAAYIINVIVTGDRFDHFRAWLVSKGRTVYMETMKYPDSLAKIECDSGTAFFKLYNNAAKYAYSKKMFLENNGPEALYPSCGEWFARQKPVIDKFFNNSDMKHDIGLKQIKNLYDESDLHIQNQYNIDDEMKKRPLKEAQKKKIRTEIKFMPEHTVSAIKHEWEYSDLKRILTNLNKKYNAGI